MIVCVEYLSDANVILGKCKIAFTKGTVACAGVILAELIITVIGLTVLVTDELADACVPMGCSSAFLAVFVLFAYRVKSINWWTVTWVRHWSVA